MRLQPIRKRSNPPSPPTAGGALGEGDAIAAAIEDRAIRALLEWVAIRSGATTIPFNRLNAFLQAYPNYPATTLFRRRAEEALIAEKRNAATIRIFFHGQRPVSPAAASRWRGR